jgi:shikimate kinase
MGTGKTTVANLIARTTGWPHLDNDVLVRRSRGAALEELKHRSGGEGLHDAESEALYDVLNASPPWVAGAAAWVVVPPENRTEIRSSGAFVVWLQARAEVLAERISDVEGRPWIAADPVGVLTAMSQARDPLYAEVSDLTVNVDDISAEKATALIMAALGRSEE